MAQSPNQVIPFEGRACVTCEKDGMPYCVCDHPDVSPDGQSWWKSVEGQHPENTEVMVKLPSGSVIIGMYETGGHTEGWIDERGNWIYPTAWRPKESEETFCVVCNKHNGHSLSCATLNVDSSVVNGNSSPEVE